MDNRFNTFKSFANELEIYVSENYPEIKFGEIKKHYVWITDKDQYFNTSYAHFEAIIDDDEISFDLHFEKLKKDIHELLEYFNPLDNRFELKPWGRYNCISHKKKFKLSDENLVEEAYKVLIELYKYAYPILINKLKQKYPLKELMMNTDQTIQEYADLLDYKKQIILKGPPGTGKTRYAEEIAKYIISENISQSDIQSGILTKEDILNNIKIGTEINSKGGNVTYIVQEINEGNIGIKSEKSKTWYPSFNKIIESFNNELFNKKRASNALIPYEDAIAKFLNDKIKKEDLKPIDTINYDLETSPFYKIVQFHPSYTYEDFVRGITTKPTENGTGIEFEGVNKVLADFATKAYDNPSKKYVLVIDEINRANLSSVFGELIYALEYRNKTVTTMYEVDHSNELTLPSNLYIIGTMNTADRSVGHIDYAIRRRFAFVHIGPKILPSNEKLIFASDLFIKVEQIFKDHISTEFKIEDVQLGHSYFIDKSDDKGSMPIRLEYEIKPILIEYVNDGILKESALEDINNLG